MGKLTIFFAFCWVIICIAGGMLQGTQPFVSTLLDEDLTAADTVISVDSTEGFEVPGFIVIDDERIAYSSVTATTFRGTLAQPLLRGAGGTEAETHNDNSGVRTVESSLINSSIDYNLAVLADSAGAQAFFSVPTAIWNIIMSFATSPFSFLGTDLQILTVLWGILFLGMAVSFFISVAGGRRV